MKATLSRTIANYLDMVFVYNRLDRIGDTALKEHLKFQRSITGQEVDQPRSTQCIDKFVQFDKAKRDLMIKRN